MSRNVLQKLVYSLITVLITVTAFIFYSTYVVEGLTWDDIVNQGWLFMFGTILPIRQVFLIEEGCALFLAILFGPIAFKLARKVFDPSKNHPMLFESAIICSTVCLMCPSMSLLAAFFYYPDGEELSVLTVLAHWIRLMCYNFPFAYFSQMFFVQPFMRRIIKLIFKPTEIQDVPQNLGKPQDEIDAITEVLKRMDKLEKALLQGK